MSVLPTRRWLHQVRKKNAAFRKCVKSRNARHARFVGNPTMKDSLTYDAQIVLMWLAFLIRSAYTLPETKNQILI